MIISFNLKDTPSSGAGGGFNFRDSLSNYLFKSGHSVTNTLDDKNIDIIFFISPLPSQSSNSYDFWSALRYKHFVNSQVKIIHRVNYTGQTRTPPNKQIDKQFAYVNKFCDHTVFISEWIKGIQQKNGVGKKNYSIILNGANSKLFFKKQFYKSSHEKLCIVTHHWSSNKNKGHDIYRSLDHLIGKQPFKNDFSFTYIGNLSSEEFPNTKSEGPLGRKKIAEALREHDIYITAADLEAAGMHHIEAACSGLPILFLEGSSITEYVEGFGESFTIDNLAEKLYLVKENYEKYTNKMSQYRNFEEVHFRQYEELFIKIVSEKNLLRTTFSEKLFIILIPIIKIFHPLFVKEPFLLFINAIRIKFLKH